MSRHHDSSVGIAWVTSPALLPSFPFIPPKKVYIFMHTYQKLPNELRSLPSLARSPQKHIYIYVKVFQIRDRRPSSEELWTAHILASLKRKGQTKNATKTWSNKFRAMFLLIHWDHHGGKPRELQINKSWRHPSETNLSFGNFFSYHFLLFLLQSII